MSDVDRPSLQRAPVLLLGNAIAVTGQDLASAKAISRTGGAGSTTSTRRLLAWRRQKSLRRFRAD